MEGAPSLVAILAGIAMAAGLAGTLVPLVPGLPLIWAAALVYGLVEGFGTAGLAVMAVITALMIGGTAAKLVLARRRAAAFGAPRATIAAGALGGIVGFFVVPVVGFLGGLVLGVVAAERRRLGGWTPAWHSATQVIAGLGVGVLLEVGAGVLMIGTWALWVGARAA
jgi:uncharacterized protein YqgC (DUF456 family)